MTNKYYEYRDDRGYIFDALIGRSPCCCIPSLRYSDHAYAISYCQAVAMKANSDAYREWLEKIISQENVGDAE